MVERGIQYLPYLLVVLLGSTGLWVLTNVYYKIILRQKLTTGIHK